MLFKNDQSLSKNPKSSDTRFCLLNRQMHKQRRLMINCNLINDKKTGFRPVAYYFYTISLAAVSCSPSPYDSGAAGAWWCGVFSRNWNLFTIINTTHHHAPMSCTHEQNHAWPSLPVNQIPNPAAPLSYRLGQHDTNAVYSSTIKYFESYS